MTFEFSAEHRTLPAYHYDSKTGEYLASTDEAVPAYTGLPANSTHMPPPASQAGFARVFSSGAWKQIADYRGTTVYVKATREAVVVATLGALRDTVTTIAPAGDYDQWNEAAGAWEEDTATKQADEAVAAAALLQEQIATVKEQKAELMREATLQVEIYCDALADTDGTFYRLMLAAWKRYRVALNHVNTSEPAGVEWPDLPDPETIAASAKEADEQAAAQAASAAEQGGSGTDEQA